MKLNNNGWGLSTFLGFSCIFAIALLIVVINAYKVGLSGDNNHTQITDNTIYSNMETLMVDASKKYISDGHCTFTNNICYVNVETLNNEKYLSNLIDKNYNKCNGYVKVTKEKNNYEYKSYLKCGNNFQTNGYVSEFAD